MTTYNVSSKQLLDNYAVLQTLENNEFAVGAEIIVATVGGDFDGTFNIHAVPQYLYTGINDEGFRPTTTTSRSAIRFFTVAQVTTLPA
jgi:hypothetical protein